MLTLFCSFITVPCPLLVPRMMFPAGTAFLSIHLQVFSAHTTTVSLSPCPHSLPGALVTLDPSIVIPSLKLDFRLRIHEYSRDGSNVRPTAVLDQTRKSPDLILAADSTVPDDGATSPLTRGALFTDRVPLGAVDPATLVMPGTSPPPAHTSPPPAYTSPPPAHVRDLHSSMMLSSLNPSQSSDVYRIITKPFFPHVATLIVALPTYQLEDILPCQLQLTFVNNGQFMYMNHSEKRPALAPAPSHLAMKVLNITPRVSKNFRDRSNIEMFSAQIEISGNDMRAFAAAEGLSALEANSPEFNNYRFSVNYLPHSNISIQNYSCPTELQFSVHYAKLLSLVEPSADRAHVSMINAYPSPPFQIVLSSSSYQILVDVVSVKSSSLYSTPFFLTLNHPHIRALRYPNALELIFSTFIGPVILRSSELLGRGSWTCDLSFYNDSRVCDCGCSSRDPDCDNLANPVHGCSDGLVCSHDGRCITQDADAVYASSACQDIKLPGSFYTSGQAYSNLAATSSSCPVCPLDLLFNQVIPHPRSF
jgi:hypothetical protein